MPGALDESEVAHVLFIDIVRYSAAPMAEQSRALQRLQDSLRATGEFQRAERAGDLLSLPTGDGMALVFFRDPAAPARCALELSASLRASEPLDVRMGIHSGPVNRVRDINAHANVSGSGINFAQRVMDLGEGGHILVSGTAADLLGQIGGWSDMLQGLGEQEVKHGARLRLFNLVTDEAGNATRPSKLEPANAQPAAHGAGAATQVAILYKRGVQPDAYVLKLLETKLTAQGHEVFVDRHMSIGVAWAAEIERRITEADAVIPLISESAVRSEMLEYELQTASSAAQQNGKPRILPIRVSYRGALHDPLAGILDPIQHAFWDSPEDDQRLVADLHRALTSPPAPRVQRASLEPVGGAVPLESEFYIVRPTDAEFIEALARGDSIVLVKGPRQIGKTSLLARGLAKSRQAGSRVVHTDWQKLSAADLSDTDSLFRALAQSISDQLDLEKDPDEAWSERRSPNSNFERYLRREALAADKPIIWAMDEVDRIFTCPYSSEVFGLFRSWHNERALDPSGPWRLLTLAIAYATEAHLFITDLSQSPFNVGTRIALEDFTLDQVADLNRRYGSPLATAADISAYFRLVGGHPYLVRRGLHTLAAQSVSLADLHERADLDDGPFGDHLKRILILLAQDRALTESVVGILRGAGVASLDAFYRLRSAGVMAGDSPADMRPRCELYRRYLARHLL